MATHQAEQYAYNMCAAFRLRLPEAMRERGMSAFDLGKKTGMSEVVVRNIQSGATHASLHVVGRFSWALGMSLTELTHADLNNDSERVSNRRTV